MSETKAPYAGGPEPLTTCPTRELPLTKGQVAIVDESDYLWLSRWKWHARRSVDTFYACRSERVGHGRKSPKITIMMHRVILGVSSTEDFVDHRNHDGLDNRRENLRSCTKSQNGANRIKTESGVSAYKGVSQHYGRWSAGIKVNQKHIHLGQFTSALEAAQAYNVAALRYFGEFACLNDCEVGRD